MSCKKEKTNSAILANFAEVREDFTVFIVQLKISISTLKW